MTSTAEALRFAGISSEPELLAAPTIRSHELKAWLDDAELNTDSDLRLQNLAGKSIRQYEALLIFESMSARRELP